MKKLITLVCLITPHPLDSSAVFAEDEPSSSELTLTVHLLNYTDVEEYLVARARRETADVFRRIGVKIVWRDVEVPKKSGRLLRS